MLVRCLLFAGLFLTLMPNLAFSETQDVHVTNFPETQKTIDVNSIPHTAMRRIENVDVGAYATLETMELSKKYLIDTNGYNKASVSIFGFSKAKNFKDCNVGIVLVPDEKAIWRAWQEDRTLLFTPQITTGATDKYKYFQGQTEVDLNFPRYMVGFFNTCESTVEISLYAYLK